MAQSKKFKETDTYFDTEGIYDVAQNMTQKDINAQLSPILKHPTTSHWEQMFDNGWRVTCDRVKNYVALCSCSEQTNTTDIPQWTAINVCTIPAEYRPLLAQMYSFVASDDSNVQKTAFADLGLDGVLRLSARDTMIKAKTYVRFYMAYIAHD